MSLQPQPPNGPRAASPDLPQAQAPKQVEADFELAEVLRFELSEGRYRVRLARNPAEVREAQRVRFEVFNEELGEGLEHNKSLGLDQDEFDVQCHHVLLIDRIDERVVGTYRVQSVEMARAGIGFYCDGEFDLSGLPDEVVAGSVETGRACLLATHRQGTGLYALWRGLAAYLLAQRARYMFGCCSLTSRDARDGLIAASWLANKGKLHKIVHVETRPDYVCAGEAPSKSELANFKLPKLFGSYLRYGALACSPPAIDRAFGTVDFLVLFDLQRLERKLYSLFFEG